MTTIIWQSWPKYSQNIVGHVAMLFQKYKTFGEKQKVAKVSPKVLT